MEVILILILTKPNHNIIQKAAPAYITYTHTIEHKFARKWYKQYMHLFLTQTKSSTDLKVAPFPGSSTDNADR